METPLKMTHPQITHPILGIDIAKLTFDACLIRPDGSLRHRTRFANSPAGFTQLAAWLTKHCAATTHACLEATSTYADALARDLHERGHRVSVVNPSRIHDFGKSRLSRTKTDKADAQLIARFCHTQAPERWTPPAPEISELQALIRHLEVLEAARQQHANQLQTATTPSVRDSLTRLINHLESQVVEVEAALQQHINRHPDLRADVALLVSIPGIGERTAARLLAEIVQLKNYESARQVAAYAGVSPQLRESGTSVHGKPRLSKTGNARVRRAVYLPAVVAKRYNPLIKALCERLAARGKPPMVQIGAAMRKLLHLAYGVLKSRQPFDPNYGRPQPQPDAA